MTSTARRNYVKVTGEMEMQVIAYKTLHPLATYDDIAEAMDLPNRTIKYILLDIPRLRGLHRSDEANEGSLKQRIVNWLNQVDFEDATELRRVLGRADDMHNIVHVLHALRKEGRVDFEEGKNRNHPFNIHLTARGRGLGLVKEEQAVSIDAPITAPEVVIEETMAEPDVEGFPLLDALLVREGERISRDTKAMAYLEAADALTSVDPDLSKELASKARALDVAYPSPIEAEYLRYVASHGSK